MKTILKVISIIGLILSIVPAFLVFSGNLDLDASKLLMLIGTVLWFVTAPFWMNKKTEEA